MTFLSKADGLIWNGVNVTDTDDGDDGLVNFDDLNANEIPNDVLVSVEGVIGNVKMFD